jgi:hypothetical protein
VRQLWSHTQHHSHTTSFVCALLTRKTYLWLYKLPLTRKVPGCNNTNCLIPGLAADRKGERFRKAAELSDKLKLQSNC